MGCLPHSKCLRYACGINEGKNVGLEENVHTSQVMSLPFSLPFFRPPGVPSPQGLG